MLVLAVDTSGRQGSIALASCGELEEFQLLELATLAGGTFSADLVPQIAMLLSRHGLGKHQLDGFVVASGPGSFTGLRIGLAAVKALAEILAKPIAAVSLLHAVAMVGNLQGKLLSALDAGRSQVYVGEYEMAHGTARLIGQSLMTQQEFQQAAKGSQVVTPDQNLAPWAQAAGGRVEIVARPDSRILAGIGCRQIRAGETVSPEALAATYILRSDSPLFVKSAC